METFKAEATREINVRLNRDMKKSHLNGIIFHIVFYPIFAGLFGLLIKPTERPYVIVFISVMGLVSLLFTSLLPYIQTLKKRL